MKRQVNFHVQVDYEDDLSGATAVIACDTQPCPQVAAMVATENMMTAYALQFGGDFEQVLELLCKGARTNRGALVAKGRPS